MSLCNIAVDVIRLHFIKRLFLDVFMAMCVHLLSKIAATFHEPIVTRLPGVAVFIVVTLIHSLMISAKMGFEITRPCGCWVTCYAN